MDESTLITLALVSFGWAALSERLATSNLTGPLVFLVSGLVLGNDRWGIVGVDVQSSTVHHLAEITLGLLLFADASTVSLGAVRHDLPTTARLLGIGLPLSMLAGTALGVVLLPELPVALAAVVGTSLAPTDAALSASVIADERLPLRVRRILNVESGMNDGIATPVVTAAIAAAATALDVVAHGAHGDDGYGALGELAVGTAVGGGIALAGGTVVRIAARRGWTQPGTGRLATLALALIAFLAAAEAGGNAFVAAFVGGLVLGAVAPAGAAEETELTETVGSLLSMVLWFVFGAGFVLPAFERIGVAVVVYALLSLTVVRMVPVAVALVGSGNDRATAAFVGWFGPRGLASVVFALLAVEELGGSDPRVTTALDTIAVTIVLSVVAHGVTARPITARYVERPALTTRRWPGPSRRRWRRRAGRGPARSDRRSAGRSAPWRR